MIFKTLAAALLFITITASSPFIPVPEAKTPLELKDMSTDDLKAKSLEDRLKKMDAYMQNIYNSLGEETVRPSFDLFKKGLTGYYNLLETEDITRKDIITLIDFTLPSDKKRLWVIDLAEKKILINELVAHGRNTGNVSAENFSNVQESHMSSQGFYITGNTYFGKHGLSLRLEGMEAGFNDNAFSRAIVMHGADYVSPDFIKTYGRLGRSLGCPSVSQEISKTLIQTIKDKTCLFIYSPALDYDSQSTFLNQTAALNYFDNQVLL